jgi:hypothetical protein
MNKRTLRAALPYPASPSDPDQHRAVWDHHFADLREALAHERAQLLWGLHRTDVGSLYLLVWFSPREPDLDDDTSDHVVMQTVRILTGATPEEIGAQLYDIECERPWGQTVWVRWPSRNWFEWMAAPLWTMLPERGADPLGIFPTLIDAPAG